MSKRLLFVANVDWFFISHRLIIAEKAMLNGFDVFVACQNTGRSDEIIEKGINFIDLNISRSGTNPLLELSALISIYKIYNNLKPDIVHHVTLKPIIYGSLISKLTNIKTVVNAVSGLGYTFTKNRGGLVQKLIVQLLRFVFNRKHLTVIFQNDDDQNLFKELNIISKIKWFLNKILFQKREQNTRNMMLLHNIKIESHRFLVQRALSLMSKNK